MRYITGFLGTILLATVASADITLTTPLPITSPATTVKVYSYTIEPDVITAHLNFYDATGGIVDQRVVLIQGTDYDAVMNDKVACPADDAKKESNMLKRKIQGIVKKNLNLTGTEN